MQVAPSAQADPLRVSTPWVWGHCKASTTFSTPLPSLSDEEEVMRTLLLVPPLSSQAAVSRARAQAGQRR
ncbi:hypothetical protein D3C80_2220930 [compost metagenome]